mgnify:CR=1 FL=1
MVLHLAGERIGINNWSLRTPSVIRETSGVLTRARQKVADKPSHFPGSGGVQILTGFNECITQTRFDSNDQLDFLILVLIGLLLFGSVSYTHLTLPTNREV